MKSIDKVPALLVRGWIVALVLASSPSLATADGPDCWRVTGVASHDTLRLRAKPSDKAKEITQIPPDARCLMSRAEHRDGSGKVTWRKVEFKKQVGWVSQKYLGEDTLPTLVRHGDEKAILGPFAKGRLRVFGKDIEAKKWCNEATLSNPDQAEVYALDGAVVLLCTGTVDGEANVVTLFRKGREPSSKTVKPQVSSHRVTDEVLALIAVALAK